MKRIVQPIFLGLLLKNSFDSDPKNNIEFGQAYLYATGVIVPSLLAILVVHMSLYEYQTISLRLKAALCSLIHKKVRSSLTCKLQQGGITIIIYMNQYCIHYLNSFSKSIPFSVFG